MARPPHNSGYHQLPLVFGGDPGILVRTEEDLEMALEQAGKPNQLVFIEVQVDKWDAVEAVREAAAASFEKNR